MTYCWARSKIGHFGEESIHSWSTQLPGCSCHSWLSMTICRICDRTSWMLNRLWYLKRCLCPVSLVHRWPHLLRADCGESTCFYWQWDFYLPLEHWQSSSIKDFRIWLTAKSLLDCYDCPSGYGHAFCYWLFVLLSLINLIVTEIYMNISTENKMVLYVWIKFDESLNFIYQLFSKHKH